MSLIVTFITFLLAVELVSRVYSENVLNDRMDCALLVLDNNAQWAESYAGIHAQGRLNVQVVDSTQLALPPLEQSEEVLRALCMYLMRFDACVLPVTHDNLVWVRKSLQLAQFTLNTPVFAYVTDLKAAALNDLLTLGVTDFLCSPFGLEELRIRTHMVKRQRLAAMALGESSQAQYLAMDPAFIGAGVCEEEDQLCVSFLHDGGATLEAMVAAVATRLAVSKESFKQAKAIVVDRFEQAYIRTALARSAGNIAMAARSVQKHRRAFWALMRKHNIDAEAFKSVSALDSHSDG